MDKRRLGECVKVLTQWINTNHGVVWNHLIQNEQRADPDINKAPMLNANQQEYSKEV